MPKLVSEIYPGTQFQRSAENGGTLTDSQTRVWRILLNNPGEAVNVQTACGIKIGDPHPVNSNIYCVSWDVKFEGDSRTILVATFNYQSTPASSDDDKNKQPPDIRPANWSTSTSVIEVPAYSWVEVGQNHQSFGVRTAPINTAGDRYDGVTRYDAIVTITIDQYVSTDPTENCQWVGSVNLEEITIGSLTCQTGSVLFRGVTSKPVVESWGDLIYRGWLASYEFAYRDNFVGGLWNGTTTYEAGIGWDIAVPQTGFNVKCVAPPAAGNVDVYGQPLKHKSGKVLITAGQPSLPDNLAAGSRARGMVKVHEYEDGGVSQLPSAQPIPLNDDGTPRAESATPKIIVRRWRPNRAINFTATFGLRLG